MASRWSISPGTTGVYTTVVDESVTAHSFGNQGVHVLATCMVGLFAEKALNQGALHLVPEGAAIVGVKQQVHHRAPAPQGALVTATTIVEQVDGSRVRYRFRVEAEGGILLADGDGESAVVDLERFLRRAATRRVRVPDAPSG